jgi:hypothetical protein
VSDIQAGTNRVAIQAATGQTYGKATEQMNAQRAVPMGAPPTEAQPVQRPVPGTLGSLTRPTERPMEPITAGANFGAGPSAVGAGIPQSAGDNALEELRMIYQMFPNDDLADLIDSYSRDGL